MTDAATAIDEIAPDVFRISAIDARLGMSFNQFLVRDAEPLLFHTGHRARFAEVSAAVATLVPLESLRWIAYSHTESDECGALDEFLAACPNAQVAQGALGCALWANDHLDDAPRRLGDGEVLVTGGHRLRHLDTPHLPHGWDARLLFDETTGTLFTSDLFTHTGETTPLTTADIVATSIETEERMHFLSVTPHTPAQLLALADLQPTTLAVMHGASFQGDGASALEALAAHYADRLAREVVRA
jgi:flavorubredoxin